MAEQKKNRKQDRHRESSQNLRYKNENRHEKSHIKRITKHLARYGDGDGDKAAVAALTAYKTKAGVFSTRPK